MTFNPLRLFLFGMTVLLLAAPQGRAGDADTNAELRAAAIEMEAGNYLLAHRHYSRLLAKGPASSELFFKAAKAAFYAGFYRQADALLRRYLAASDDAPAFLAEANALAARLAEILATLNASDDVAFAFAHKEHTIFAYAAYHRAYPEGTHVAEADSLSFARAKELGSERAYERYGELWPEGSYLAEAASAADSAAFKAALKINRDITYRAYLQAYPNGKFRKEAMEREEAQSFNRAKSMGTAAAIEAFLDSHPNTRFTADARKASAEATARQGLYAFVGPVARIPAGSFQMGRNSFGSSSHPAHMVRISSAFEMTLHEITFNRWQDCVDDGGCGGYIPDDNGWGRNTRPVVNVSWQDIDGYIGWLNGKWAAAGGTGFWRLPSEAEWAYAARGRDADASIRAAIIDRTHFNCSDCADQPSDDATFPTGSFNPNSFGLFDLYGNAAEWVQDCWHDSFDGAPADGNAWLSGDTCGNRVIRGGLSDTTPVFMIATHRKYGQISARLPKAGFRLVRSLDN